MMSGVLALDWKQYTLKVLWIMFQSKLLDDYDHTSRLMMMQSWTKKPSTFFHPFRKSGPDPEKLKVTKDTMFQMARVFLDG